jgi:hypothetical protein
METVVATPAPAPAPAQTLPVDITFDCRRCGAIFKKPRYFIEHMKRYENKNSMCAPRDPSVMDVTYDELRREMSYKPKTRKAAAPASARPTIKQIFEEIRGLKTQIDQLSSMKPAVTSTKFGGDGNGDGDGDGDGDDRNDRNDGNDVKAMVPFFMNHDIVGLALAMDVDGDHPKIRVVSKDGPVVEALSKDGETWVPITDEQDIDRILNNSLKRSCENLLAVGADFLVLDEMRRLAGQSTYSPKAAIYILNEAFAELTSAGYEDSSLINEMKKAIFGDGLSETIQTN